MNFSPKHLALILEKKGYALKRTGSHHVYFTSETEKPLSPLFMEIKIFQKELSIPILKQAGISKDEV